MLIASMKIAVQIFIDLCQILIIPIINQHLQVITHLISQVGERTI